MKQHLLSRGLYVLLVLTMIFTLTACGNETKTSETKIDNTKQEETAVAAKTDLKFILHNEPEILDPVIAADSSCVPIFTNVFEGLTTLNGNDQVVPGVAESWDINEDGTVYTFHIRDNAKWSDGEPVVADNFIYTWEKVMNSETAADYAWIMLPYIKNAQSYFDGKVSFEEVGVKAIDEKTLEVTLENPTAYFLELCSFYTYAPLRKDIVDSNPEWSKNVDTYVTNGPFKLSDIQFGQYIKLEKNENYWNRDSVKLTSIQFDFVPEVNTALSAFEAGSVDGMVSVPSAEIPRLKLESDAFNSMPKIQTIFINLNTELKPLDDVRVRKALNLAIDKQALIDQVLKGSQIPANGLVPPGIKFAGVDFREEAGDDLGNMEDNIKEAKRLMAEAGYPDGAGFPVFVMQDDDSSIPEVVAKMWEDNLGIKTEIKVVEFKVLISEMKKTNIDIAVGGWTGDYQHPTTFLDMYTPNSGTNYTNWNSDEYNQFLEDASKELDDNKSLEMYIEAEKLILSEQPIIPLYYGTYNNMVIPSLIGWHQSPMGYLSFKEAYFE